MAFEIKIEGLEDFKAFVRIIRNQDNDDEQLLKEAAELKSASTNLENAITSQTSTKGV